MGGRSDSAPPRSWATLAEAIKGIRAELSDAMAAGEGERLRFDVGAVELEFAVDVQRDLQARAGVKVWVVEIGGSGGWSRDSAHRVKVTLNPVDTTTERSPRVADHLEGVPPRPGPR
jgi:hypothetical protein